MNDTPPDATRFRKLLLELREELIASQADGKAASGTVELDQARVGRLSRMDALQAQYYLGSCRFAGFFRFQ
jgi:DnaK suppressor protein